jgi:putative hydrolase of the HAD superfamily
MALTNKKHVFFDLDDTLWDFRTNSSAVLGELFNEFELAKKLNVTAEEFLVYYRSLNLQLWSQFYKRQLSKEQMRSTRFDLTFANFNYSNPQESVRFSDEYIKRAPHGTALMPGCIDVLDYLHRKYHLHLITNGFIETQAIKIDGCGLRKYFRNIIISEEHGLVKPELPLFRLAESLADAVPSECVMIGDSLESDIEGALQAGWDAVFFAETNDDRNRGKHIRHLTELKSFL